VVASAALTLAVIAISSRGARLRRFSGGPAADVSSKSIGM